MRLRWSALWMEWRLLAVLPEPMQYGFPCHLCHGSRYTGRTWKLAVPSLRPLSQAYVAALKRKTGTNLNNFSGKVLTCLNSILSQHRKCFFLR